MNDKDTHLLAEAYNNIKKQHKLPDRRKPINIFDFINDWKDEGYGIALISPDDIVVDAYIDPSDYPQMILSYSGSGASAINPEHNGYWIKFHSGSLEHRIGKDWFSKT